MNIARDQELSLRTIAIAIDEDNKIDFPIPNITFYNDGLPTTIVKLTTQ